VRVHGPDVEHVAVVQHGDDEVIEQPRQSKQRPAAQPEPNVRSRAGSSGASAHGGRNVRCSGSGTVASGRSGVRGVVSVSFRQQL
jgi:hypothetical protein